MKSTHRMLEQPPADMTIALESSMPELEEIYVDLHKNPELSMQETRTASLVEDRLAEWGYDVTSGVGGTGVVGVLANGRGPTVMLRADMDGLPVREETGLVYASTKTQLGPDGESVPVMHACGHDMHVTCLLGAAKLLASHRDGWAGTLVTVFQPAEETAAGAKAMIDDGLFDRIPPPDVVLGQHVSTRPAGLIGCRAGSIMAAADSMEIKLIGRGGHASQPQTSVDPIVMAAAVVLRLQTIIAREVAPNDAAVVTVGSIHAGTKENIIPDIATLKVNVRSLSGGVRTRVLGAIERVVRAEAAASGAPADPQFIPIHNFPLTVNDPDATARVVDALSSQFGAARVEEIAPRLGSEDFGRFGTAGGAPSVFWFIGSSDPASHTLAEQAGRVDQDIPGNHSARFAPVIQPTLATGVQALTTAARAWFSA